MSFQNIYVNNYYIKNGDNVILTDEKLNILSELTIFNKIGLTCLQKPLFTLGYHYPQSHFGFKNENF